MASWEKKPPKSVSLMSIADDFEGVGLLLPTENLSIDIAGV